MALGSPGAQALSAGKKLQPFQKKAHQLFSDSVRLNEPLSRHTTFRIGGPASIFFKINDFSLLKKILYFCQQNRLKIFVIGKGSNLLFSDKGFDGAVLKLEGEFEKIKQKGKNTLIAAAAASLQKLCFMAQDAGLSGLEWAWGLPATVGGAVATNAGAFGVSIAKNLKSLTVFDIKKNRIFKIPSKKIKFSYRLCHLDKNLIILEAEIKLTPADKKSIQDKMAETYQLRQLRQPLEFPSAGSIFKNPSGKFAGELIEKAGLKGKKIGGAEISEKHANFIINKGGAKAADVLKLIQLIKNKIKTKFAVQLKEEIVIVK